MEHGKRPNLNAVDQKLRRDDHGGEKTCGRIEQTQPCLFADVGDVTKIPRHQIIDLVKRGKSDMYGVGKVFR